MLEIELSRRMGVSLDDVYKLASEFHRIFDSFEEIIQEQKQEYEDEIERLQEEHDSTESSDGDFESQIRYLEEDLSNLESENKFLKELLTEHGIDYEE